MWTSMMGISLQEYTNLCMHTQLLLCDRIGWRRVRINIYTAGFYILLSSETRPSIPVPSQNTTIIFEVIFCGVECFTAIQYNVVILLDALRPQEMAFMRSLDGMAWNRCRSSISRIDSWQVLLLVLYTQNSMGPYIMRGKKSFKFMPGKEWRDACDKNDTVKVSRSLTSH